MNMLGCLIFREVDNMVNDGTRTIKLFYKEIDGSVHIVRCKLQYLADNFDRAKRYWQWAFFETFTTIIWWWEGHKYMHPFISNDADTAERDRIRKLLFRMYKDIANNNRENLRQIASIR